MLLQIKIIKNETLVFEDSAPQEKRHLMIDNLISLGFKESDITSELFIKSPEDIRDAREFLISTDWYVTRFLEIGTEIPQEIKDKRAQARLDAGE